MNNMKMTPLPTMGFLTTGVALALALVAAACGSDEADVLTQAEAEALFTRLHHVALRDTTPPIHISEDSLVVACPQGGRAKIVAGPWTGIWVADTFRTALDAEVTPDGCQLQSGALSFTAGGDPSFRYQETLDIIGTPTPTGAAATGSLKGGITWQAGDGRSGACAIDLALSAVPDLSNPDQPKLNGVLKGRLCDYDVEIDSGDLLGFGAG